MGEIMQLAHFDAVDTDRPSDGDRVVFLDSLALGEGRHRAAATCQRPELFLQLSIVDRDRLLGDTESTRLGQRDLGLDLEADDQFEAVLALHRLGLHRTNRLEALFLHRLIKGLVGETLLGMGGSGGAVTLLEQRERTLSGTKPIQLHFTSELLEHLTTTSLDLGLGEGNSDLRAECTGFNDGDLHGT